MAEENEEVEEEEEKEDKKENEEKGYENEKEREAICQSQDPNPPLLMGRERGAKKKNKKNR